MHRHHIKPRAPAGISNLKVERKTVAISDGLTRFYKGIKRCLPRNTLTFGKSQYRVSYVYIILWNSLKTTGRSGKEGYQRQQELYTHWVNQSKHRGPESHKQVRKYLCRGQREKTGLIKTRFKDRYLDIDFKVLVHVLSIGGRHLYKYFMKLIRMQNPNFF